MDLQAASVTRCTPTTSNCARSSPRPNWTTCYAPAPRPGAGVAGDGCPDALAAGLMEPNRGDGSLGMFLGVQVGLAMRSIALLGSEEQKQRWLQVMARLDKLGAFALTEPDHGSDSIALETSARRDGESYVINGAKKWIGNGRHRGPPHLRGHRGHADADRRPRHHRGVRLRLTTPITSSERDTPARRQGSST
jgi:hypothetical protein